jgi:hypothetical protein
MVDDAVLEMKERLNNLRKESMANEAALIQKVNMTS